MRRKRADTAKRLLPVTTVGLQMERHEDLAKAHPADFSSMAVAVPKLTVAGVPDGVLQLLNGQPCLRTS